MSERRSSTICAIVERPDQHCGDDFVILFYIFIGAFLLQSTIEKLQEQMKQNAKKHREESSLFIVHLMHIWKDLRY